ncbi:glycosyltransferase family 2 protein [Salinibacter sp.]|uniref:glycosyltransferase family 2 protein n=1 Tax=Salinibacter sp. TaxID=2065818 RepID=UPI0021E7FA81|nr:glycosyltransferase family 2 protein [Salinibacter sp.]
MSIDTPSLSDLPAPPPGKTGWPWTEQSDALPETQPDGTPWPKISIVTPSYNQGQFIEETIRSVLLQRYPNLEYIVMDGGSTDGTVEILEKYDPWIAHWVSEPDDGQSDAINKGFERATGDTYAWLNSDDYYAPGGLSAVAKRYGEAEKKVGALVGTGHKVNCDGDIVYTPEGSDLTHEAFLNWLNGGSFMQPACFFRRQAWEECGPLREDLRYPMDVDLWLKMARGYDFDRVGETIAFAYEHKGAKTTGERPYMRAETIKLISEYGGREAAWRELDRMAEDLADARQKIEYIKSTLLYKYIVGPLYKAFLRKDH